MRVIILAGGKGTRLYSYTTVLPKPLMPVADVPILDVILRQLSGFGFRRATLAVGYLADLIKAYVGNGSRYGLKVDYEEEEKPLGTIGPLSRVKGLKSTFLVMNGDLLTTMNLSKMLKFHKQSKNIATVAIKKRKVTVDYGVVDFDKDLRLLSHREKPVLKYYVGIGICYFEPAILKYIPKNKRYDFPDLVGDLVARELSVGVYESRDYWRDIGRWEDYMAAQKEFMSMRKIFLKRRRKIK